MKELKVINQAFVWREIGREIHREKTGERNVWG